MGQVGEGEQSYAMLTNLAPANIGYLVSGWVAAGAGLVIGAERVGVGLGE